MKTGHCFSILNSIQTKGQGKPLGQLLDGVELLGVPPDVPVLLLQLIELVDERLDHGLGVVDLVEVRKVLGVVGLVVVRVEAVV